MKTIMILGEQYKIEKVKAVLNSFHSGECEPSSNTLRVGDNAPVPFYTMLHEIVHGYIATCGCPLPTNGEDFCNLVAAIIESLLRQNGLSVFKDLHSMFYSKDNK